MTLRALYDVPAPAKLNLFLHVIGRRPDGYHLLQSLFVLIDWADTLHFELRDGTALARHDLGPALPDDDLCLRAARALQTASASQHGVDISINKQVPWGAGLGGGSSDAASTLLALNRLWGLHWPRQRLAQIGLQLGADVPFFIGGQNALVEGVGDTLTPLAVPPAHYAVIKPAAGIATRDIFEDSRLKRDTEPVIVMGFSEGVGCIDAPPEWTQGFGKNDLQNPAQIRCPEVVQAARWLEARYGNSRMTGSGSALFARVGTAESSMVTLATKELATKAFPTKEFATYEFATEELPATWTGRMCRSLVEHPLRGWAG